MCWKAVTLRLSLTISAVEAEPASGGRTTGQGRGIGRCSRARHHRFRIPINVLRGVAKHRPPEPDESAVASAVTHEGLPRTVVAPPVELNAQAHLGPAQVSLGDQLPVLHNLQMQFRPDA